MNAARPDIATTISEAVAKVIFPLTAKKGAAFLTGLYVLGLIVTNEASIAIGAVDFALPKYQAIFTGAWSLVLILIGASPVETCYSWMSTTRSGPLKLVMLPLAFASGFLFSVFAALMLLIFVGVGTGAPFTDLPSLSVVGTRFRIPAVLGWIQLTFVGLAVGEIMARVYVRSRYGLLSITFVGGLISTWILATALFPYIPKQFGGGRPEPVRFMLTPDGAKAWGTLCNSWATAVGETTGTVKLNLTEKEDYIVTLTIPKNTDRTGASVTKHTKLNKTLVTGIIQSSDGDLQPCALQ